MERYRIHAEAAVYYLTYAIVEWLPVFVAEASCKIVTDSLTFCHGQKHLRINAYVIMPTHVHLIAFDAEWDVQRLARTLTDFRKYTGRQLSDYCAHHGPKCFLETLRAQAVGIGSAASGSRAAMPKRFRASAFGSKSWTICMTIPVARDWCSARTTGAFRRLPGTSPTEFGPSTCR